MIQNGLHWFLWKHLHVNSIGTVDGTICQWVWCLLADSAVGRRGWRWRHLSCKRTLNSALDTSSNYQIMHKTPHWIFYYVVWMWIHIAFSLDHLDPPYRLYYSEHLHGTNHLPCIEEAVQYSMYVLCSSIQTIQCIQHRVTDRVTWTRDQNNKRNVKKGSGSRIQMIR